MIRRMLPGGKKLFFSLIISVLITACTPDAVLHKEPLKENGEVFVFLQPLPEEADRLVFSIDNISLVAEDGTEFPLRLSLDEVKGGRFDNGQKLLGSAVVPQGEYNGISITAGDAYFDDTETDTSLLVPDDPVRAEHAFRVDSGKARTLFLTLRPAESLSSNVVFAPSFQLTSHSRELFTLTGFVTNSYSNTISVFNKKTMMNAGIIATGMTPRGLVLDQERGRAFAAVSEDDAIVKVNAFSGEITDRLKLELGDEPVYLCLTPDGTKLVSVNHGSNSVSLIDTGAMYETARIRLDDEPVSAVIDPLGLRAYIMSPVSNTISVIDISSEDLAATIAVEGGPVRAAFSGNGDSLFIVHNDIPDMTVIDPSGLSVTKKIFIGSPARSIKVDTRTGLVLAGNKSGGGISIVDPSSSMFIDSIQTKGTVVFMTIDDQENTLFALVPGRKILQKINLTSKKNIAEMDVGEGAYAVVVMGER